MTKQSYKKFVATAATATLVASALAPVAASAATENAFTDVGGDYIPATNYLAEKGITGFGNGIFKPSQDITRADAAVLIAKVLGLPTDAPAAGFTDVKRADAVVAVNALKAAGITNGKTDTTFGATDQVTRGEVAIWLQRAFKLETGADAGFTDAHGQYKNAVNALKNAGVTNGKTATTFGVVDNITRGELAIFLYKLGKEEVVTEVKVDSVKAINSTEAAVTFTNAVKEIKPANVKVTDKAGNSVFVSKIDVEKGNKNATLTFVDKFKKDGEYKVTFTGLKDADGKDVAEQTASFKYEAAAVKEIKFTQTTVAPKADLTKYVTILDDLGRDVTKEHKVTFETAKEEVVKADGTVGESGSVIVVAVVKDGDKVVKSAKTTIKVSAAAPAEFVGSYVYTDKAAEDTEAFNKLKDEEKVNYIFDGDKKDKAKKLAVYYKDQYGKKVEAKTKFNKEDAPKLENLTPTVAIVENDGEIKPISKGTAYVKVTLGEIVQTIAIEVKADAAITTMQVAPETVSVVAGQDATSKVTFKDQYGKEQQADAKSVTVEPKDKEVATATFDDKTGDVKVKGVKEGSTTVKVTYKSGELELTKDIAVKVEKAGDLQEYKAVVKDTTLDAGNTEKDEKKAPNSTTITVDKIDTNGNKIGAVEANDVKLVEVDKDGKEVTETGKKLVDVKNTTVTTNKDGKEGTAYVQVSVGTLVIDTVEIKVVNTTATATTAEFDRLDLLFKDGFTVAEDGTVTVTKEKAAQGIDLDKELKTIIKVLDQDGKVMEGQDLNITFTTTNANGLEVNDKKITKVTNASATVDVVVTDVKVGEKSLIKSPVQVKVAVKVDEQKAATTLSSVSVINADNDEKDKINYNPYGAYSTNLKFEKTQISNMTSLKVSLLKDTEVLAVNDLAFDRINEDTKKATSISSPFNLGTGVVDKWAWKRGAYAEGKTTSEDFKNFIPTHVKVDYVINGIAYSETLSINETLNVPNQKSK